MMLQPGSRTFQARRALLRELAPHYQQASLAQKTLLLDSVVERTGYTRKYAIALLNHGRHDQQTIKRHRLPHYSQAVQQALSLCWKAAHYVCAKRLLPSLPSLVALLERQGHLQLTDEERHQVLGMSVSTVERYLCTQHKPRLHGLSTTTPGSWCKAQLPLCIFSPWEENRPGFVEMDLVAHCGDHLDGKFLSTMTVTDLATGWTECLPLLEKSADAVLAALSRARVLLPFPLLGIDTDSGSEFLNEALIAYCEQEQITFTRGRPGVKNDQSHVEQKNGAVVREAVGYVRLVGMRAYQQLGEVYRALRLMVNYVQPSLKLQAKVLKGERVRRVYDAAQTPLQRVLASGVLTQEQQRALYEQSQQIDPLLLSEQLDALRHALLCGAHLPALVNECTWPLLCFSLAACTAGSLLRDEEGPGQTEPQEAPWSKEESVNEPPPALHPFADVGEESREVLMHYLGPTHGPLRAEYIQGGPVEFLPTESFLPEEAVWAAEQDAGQASSLPTSTLESPSSIAGEQRKHHADQVALPTLEQAIAAYVQQMRATGRAAKTLQWHQTSLGALRRSLWKQFHLTDVGSLTRTHLQAWVSELPMMLSVRTGARRSVNTVAAYARSARAFCNWLLRQGYVSAPLFPQGAVPQAQRRLPHLVEPEAFARLLRACELTGPPGGLNAGMTARNRAILWLLLETGLSVSEVCCVSLTDVDCVGGTVTAYGKRGQQRTFPLSVDGRRAVCAYLEQARLMPSWKPAVPEAQERLLLTERGHPLTKNSVTLLFLRLNQRAGLATTPICPSMLRDTYAIRFLQAGGEPATLQKQLGVADLVSVKRYQHVWEQQEAQKYSHKPLPTRPS